jgi:drug/metabolite transporter (DMT)-like permease
MPGGVKFFIPYGFIIALVALTLTGAYLNTTFASAIFLHDLSPAFVAIFSFLFLKERISILMVFSFILAFIGICFIVGTDATLLLNGRYFLGDGLAIISAVAYAGLTIYSRYRAREKMDIYYSIFWANVFAMLFLLPFNLAYGSFAVQLDSLKWVVLLALVSTNAAYFTFCKGLEYIEAPKASIVALAELVFVNLNAFLFFNESLTPPAIIGAVLICSSIILLQARH